MLIESSEVFKSWLEKKLTPICDAEPLTLAKYIVALVKKDKPKVELKELCYDQLEVFLQDKTKEFVDELFVELELKVYLTPTTHAPEPTVAKDTAPEVSPAKLDHRHDALRVDSHRDERRKRDDRWRDGDRRNHDRRGYTHRPNHRRGFNRGRRNRSRERETRHHVRRSRTRSKSPNSRGSTPTQDDHGDTTTRSKERQINNRLPPLAGNAEKTHKKPRCPDYEGKGFCMDGDLCQFDHGADPVVVNDAGLLKFKGPPPPPSIPPPSCPPICPPPPPPGMMPLAGARGPMPPPIHMAPPPFHAMRSIRPLMAPPGDMFSRQSSPPPPPGTVIMLPKTTVDSAISTETRPMPPDGYNPEAPSLRPRSIVSLVGGNSCNVAPPPVDYIPEQKVGIKRPGGHFNPSTFPALKRFDGGGRNDYNSRLGGKPVVHTNCSLQITKIPVEFNNIAKLNEHFGNFGTITNIQVCFEGSKDTALVTFSSNAEANAAYRSTDPIFNNRFIRVFWHKSGSSGLNATTTTTTVIDSTSQFPSSGLQQPQGNFRLPVKERLGALPPPPHKLQLNNNIHNIHNNNGGGGGGMTISEKKVCSAQAVALSPTGSVTKTVYNVVPAANDGPDPAVVAAKKALEDKNRNAMKKKIQLQRSRQDLLQKLIKSRKEQIENLEKHIRVHSASEKEVRLKIIEEISLSIKKLQDDLLPSNTKASGALSMKEAQKELLDTELELMKQPQESSEAQKLKNRLRELQEQARFMGLGVRGRGRGGSPGLRSAAGRGRGTVGRGLRGTSLGKRPARGRGTLQSGMSVDRRPKQLVISGYDPAKKEALLVYLADYGKMEVIDDDVPTCTLMVGFASRQEAEQAKVALSQFSSDNMCVAWATVSKTISVNANLASGLKQSTDGVLEEDLHTDADLEEEEEDEEEESRSWRRR